MTTTPTTAATTSRHRQATRHSRASGPRPARRSISAGNTNRDGPIVHEVVFGVRGYPLDPDTFYNFLQTRYMEENYEFWLAAERFRQVYDEAYAASVAGALATVGITRGPTGAQDVDEVQRERVAAYARKFWKDGGAIPDNRAEPLPAVAKRLAEHFVVRGRRAPGQRQRHAAQEGRDGRGRRSERPHLPAASRHHRGGQAAQGPRRGRAPSSRPRSASGCGGRRAATATGATRRRRSPPCCTSTVMAGAAAAMPAPPPDAEAVKDAFADAQDEVLRLMDTNAFNDFVKYATTVNISKAEANWRYGRAVRWTLAALLILIPLIVLEALGIVADRWWRLFVIVPVHEVWGWWFSARERH